jgi:ATP-dependent DNA helicase
MALPDNARALKLNGQAAKKAAKTTKRPAKGRRSTRAQPADEDEDVQVSSAVEDQVFNGDFPVVITTYEMIIRDRIHLARYSWGYIVVDEGHRLKNLNCKLMKEIAKYHSACRMILTGTPLQVRLFFQLYLLRYLYCFQNNLSELWSLLHFVLPDIFTDVEAFEEW